MKTSFCYLLTLLLITSVVSCTSSKDKDKAVVDAGWITIFDGKSFNGWRGYNMDRVPSLWTIEADGSMKINGKGGNEGTEDGGDLLYDRKLKNFEFEVEWKVAQVGANSGILYLGQEVPDEPLYISAPEYQVLGNNDNEPSLHKSASLYDMIAATPQNANPVGEWNKAKIVVDHGHVVHYQNNVAVVEYSLWTAEWEEMVNKSKFNKNDWPLAYEYFINLGGENKEGYIGFQDHGHEVYFRNIRLKELK